MPAFAQISKRLKAGREAVPPGRFSFGTQLTGGPRRTDAFGAKRGPTLLQLAENYGALIYAMVARNRNAVARLPMRLMMDGSRGQGGAPGRACDAIKVSRDVGKDLAQSGQISTSAIDQIYEIRNHPLLDTLDSPDPYGTFTRQQFIGLACANMDVFGSHYIVPEGNGWDWRSQQKSGRKGPPEALWIIYPQYTIPIRMAGSPIVEWFQYFGDRLPCEAVMWLRHNHSLRDVYGSAFGPTEAGEAYRQQEQEQVAILSQVLGLGPRPNLLVSAKDPMLAPNRDEADALKADLVRQHAGGNAGGILVNTGGFDVTPISYPPADLASSEIAEQDKYILACIFDQPPTYYTVDSNLANLEAADRQHWRQGVEPRCVTIAAAFTRLAKQYDPRLMFKFDSGEAQDDLVKAQVDQIYLQNAAITINELNEEKRFPKKPWGDAPWMPGTLKQPDMIVEQHEQSLEQADQQMESGGIQDDLAVDGHEHQKKMDKESLKQKEERAIDETLALIRSIKGELERRAG